jgi:hypothetical protein
MPQLSGVELAYEVLRDRSDVRVLLMSGSTRPVLKELPFLWKPFTIDEFVAKVEEVFNGPAQRFEQPEPS